MASARRILRLPARCLLLLFAAYTHARSTNRTIDDEYGDSVTGLAPEYSPPGAWHQGSTCQACFVQLDGSQVLEGSWHDTTHHGGDPEPRSITMRFNGTAVYVYGVLANNVPFTDTLTNLTFAIDGAQVGTFVHEPTNSTFFDYNVPVYANPKLENSEHTLKIQAVGDSTPSLILFDYVVYTYTDPEPQAGPSSTAGSGLETSGTPRPDTESSSSSTPIGAIVGGTVALLAIVSLLVFFLYCRRRRDAHIRVLGEETPRLPRARPGSGILASESVTPFSVTVMTQSAIRPPIPAATMSTSSATQTSLRPFDATSMSPVLAMSHHNSSATSIPLTSLEAQASSEASASHSFVPTNSSADGYIHDRLGAVNVTPGEYGRNVLQSQVTALRKEIERLQEQRRAEYLGEELGDDGRGETLPRYEEGSPQRF